MCPFFFCIGELERFRKCMGETGSYLPIPKHRGHPRAGQKGFLLLLLTLLPRSFTVSTKATTRKTAAGKKEGCATSI